MAINLGATAISDVKLGSTQVGKIYLGTTEVWSKGGGGPTEWGLLSYHSGFSVDYNVEFEEYCTVNNIDGDTLGDFMAARGATNEAYFSYDEGEGGWLFNYEGDIISQEAMLSTTGIDVTLNEGASLAELYISKSAVVDPSSPVVSVALTQSEYNSLSSQPFHDVHGESIPSSAIVSFSFGTLATTTPNNFLANSSVTSVDFTNANSLTSITYEFLAYTSITQPITLPNTVTTIGQNFLAQCSSFNQPITLSSSLTTIGSYFMSNCSSFNQSLTLPNSLTTIDRNFLSGCRGFSQPLTLPDSITSIGTAFMWLCTNYTSTIDFGSLHASVAPSDADTIGNFLATMFASDVTYSVGKTIVGTYVDEWKTKFPDEASNALYRKLIVGS